MESYAGVDWASEKHDVRVADAAGEELLAATFAHDEQGLRSLCRQLVRLKVELVAVERPDGLLVERLLDAGLRVLALHPNQVAAARDRFRVSGGKSDRFDAFVLCELARTDHHRFRVLEPDSDRTKALRALTRAREDLVGTRTALTNQLRAELERFWPGPLRPVQRSGQPDLAGVPGALPKPGRRARAGRGAPRGVPGPRALQRPAEARPAACQAPARAHGRVGELELTHPPTARADIRRDDQDAERADQGARASDRDRDPRASRRRDLSVAVQRRRVITRRGAARRDRRLPRPLPLRDALAGDAGQAAVAIESGKRKAAVLSLGLQQASARRVLHAGGQHPPLAPLGARRATPPLARAATTTPARFAPSDGPGVASCGSAGKTRVPYDPARHHALQRQVTVTIPTPSGPRPDISRHPADGRRRRHPTGGPQGRARSA